MAGAPASWTAALESAPFGLAVFDAQHRFVYVNSAMAEINGLPGEAHIGRHPEELFGPIVERWLRLVEQCRSTGAVVGPQRLTFDRDGPRIYETYYYPMPLDGEAGTVAIVRDISNRAMTERRSALLSTLAQTLTAAASRDTVAIAAGQFLHEAYGARSAVATRQRGSHHLVVHPAIHGYQGEGATTVSGRRLSINGPTALAVSAREMRFLEVETLDDVLADGSLLDGVTANVVETMLGIGDHSGVWVPVPDPVDVGVALGVLRLTWTEPHSLDAGARATLETAAALVGLALHRLELAEQSARDVFRQGLEAMLDNVTIGRAVRDESGAIVDFVIDYANAHSIDPEGHTAAVQIGRRMSELYNRWSGQQLIARYATVVENGVPFVDEQLRYGDRDPDPATDSWWQVRAARLDQGFIAASRDITEEIARHAELTEARIHREAENQAMRLLQTIAIPDRLPVMSGIELAAHYRSADEDVPIGGDWYDTIVLDENRVMLMIGDVAGHGKEAAATMVRLRNMIAAFSLAGGSPAIVLARTSDAIGPAGSVFATCCCVLVDAATQQLTICSAGHLPPVLATERGAWTLEGPHGPPIGTGPASYRQSVAQLEAPATLLLYTDGLIERRGGDLQAAIETLPPALSALAGRPAAVVCNEITAMVTGEELEDDFCVLVARFPG